MPDSATILLVDDEESVQKLLTYPLERDGYRVVQARDGGQALALFDRESVDLVVLDVMLPEVDGLEVCKRLRARSSVPIVMLTARDDELDKVLGLELGADDYITKPFSIREFRSRVRALLRRAAAPRHEPSDEQAILVDGLRIDPARRSVERDGTPVQLTYVEFELLRTMATRPGRVFSRQALLEAVWGASEYRDPRTIDVHVRHLRQKLERDPREPAVHPHGPRSRLPVPRAVRGEARHERDGGAFGPGAGRGRGAAGVRRLVSGVGARLGLALLVVLAGALTLVYLIVVPSLESRLIHSRVSELRRAVAGMVRELPADRFQWPDFLEAESASANARVVVFDEVGPPTALVVAGDSQGFELRRHRERPARARRRGTRPGGLAGRRSTPTRSSPRPPCRCRERRRCCWSPRRCTTRSPPFALARDRLILAGALALVGALAVGYLGALLFARRLRRLETAAERIAAGRFDEPVHDAGTDEVGQLARTFDRMRQRLATLDHARREFIANASHELRTPLFSLGGFLELLTDEELDEETRVEFLATMREQVDRLAKLATELLDLSRVDAGQLQVAREPLALDQAAATAVDEFAAVALAEGRPLVLEAGEGPQVLGDEQRVLQIARSLIENALVHTPPGTRVRVRARAGTLEVEDDGPGIVADQAEHVFERFYRVEGRRASGSGLGLAIARELARAMDGTLELESEPGRTVFRLRLPVAEDRPVVAPRAAR